MKTSGRLILTNLLISLIVGISTASSFSAPVYIKNFSSFPAYPYNTVSYMQGGAYVGCGPTTGAMMMGYFHHVEGMSGTDGLLTSPGSGVNEGLNTAWTLHGSTYMNTGANGFGSVYNIEPGLENYAAGRGYKMKAMIHVSTLYNPGSSNPDPAWLNQYGPYGDSWLNDGDFWTYSGGVWGIDANKFCDFVGVKLAAGIAIFLTIDTDLNGSGDHWVALVGYDKSTLKYAFYDTYSTTVQWADIYYCGTTPRKDNSISMLRSVAYEGPIQQNNPPRDLVALTGYHGAVPLAWNKPSGTMLHAISTDMKTTESMDDVESAISSDNFPSDGSILNSLFDDHVGNVMSLSIQSSAAALTGYNVYRSTSSGGSYTKIAGNITRQYYRDESVTNGTTYYYKVTAVYSSGESGYSGIVNAIPAADGYVIKSNWTTTTPTLNGMINASEWSAATAVNILFPGAIGTVTLYIMNNNSTLFLAVDDKRDTHLDNLDQFAIFFDENFDREWPSSSPPDEGNFWIAWDAGSNSSFTLFGPRTGFWPNNLVWPPRTTPAGVSKGISISSGNVQYEGSFDFSQSPLNTSAGSKIGILVFTHDATPNYFNSFWPQQAERLKIVTPDIQYWGQAPFSFGDLILAASASIPDIAVNPGTWNYGSVTIAGYSDKTFVVKNEGTATLNISSIVAEGDITQFSVENGGGTSSLAPGATLNVVVRFKPTSTGTKYATVKIYSNDPDENPFLVGLTGAGTVPSVPDIAATPASWSYGSVAVGSSSDKTFVIKNEGTANLNVTGTTLAGANASEFSIQSGGGTFTLAPGATKDIMIKFAPTDAGSKSASLSISSNDPDENPFFVTLTGIGSAPSVPDIAATPASWNYGSVAVGSSSDKTFVIKNEGTTNLGVTATTLIGANASEFSLQSGGGAFTLAPGATRDIVVRFSPTSAGSKSAVFRIGSNDPDENPFDVTLTGIGTAVAGIPINPVTTTPQMAGIEFWVSIDVGTSANPVTDLFGISFDLNYTNTNYINYVAAEAGSFIGADVIFFPTPDDANAKVSIGLSRKAPQTGVNGFGTVARVKLIADAATPNNTSIQLMISNVIANNSAGAAIPLLPGKLNITIQSGLIVWPGDTNNNGVVDQADILPLGLHWGKTGSARQNASTAWSGQLATPWNPQAATYADANGDGNVNQADILPIGLNWNKTHASVFAKPAINIAQADQANATNLSIAITGDTNPGNDFIIDIFVNSATNLFGLSFDLFYSPIVFVDPLTAEAGANNMMGNDVIYFSMINRNAGNDTGGVSVGISRKSGQGGISGSGLVTRIAAHMASSAASGVSNTRLSLQNIMANDPDGNPIAVDIGVFNLISEIEDQSSSVPYRFALSDNYPNPFNAGTTIEFALPKPTFVTLKVFNLLGEEIAVLSSESRQAGTYKLNWDAQGLVSGVYLYRMEAEGFSETKKLILMR